MKHKNKNSELVPFHFDRINRSVIEGDSRVAFIDFLESKKIDKMGIYGLCDKEGRLIYVGKAQDLQKRLDNHLNDKLGDKWEYMTLFFLSDVENVKALEKLIIYLAKPEGNKQGKKRLNIGKDLRRDAFKYVNKDSSEQNLKKFFYTDGKQQTSDKLSRRITLKKLKSLKNQKKLATALGITQPRVSQLINADKTGETFRRYVQEAGVRDKVILILEKQKE